MVAVTYCMIVLATESVKVAKVRFHHVLLDVPGMPTAFRNTT